MSILPGSTLGILGGGQLGRMIAMAARTLGYRVAVMDPDPHCACAPVADFFLTASFEDAAAVEELAHRDIARRLAQGADRTLGVADRTGLEVLEGHRLSDLSGRELTDGMIVRRGRDGVLDVVTVVEAKAGPSAAQGLRRTASELGDPEEFARFVIEQDRSRVVTVLRTAGLGADADAVARGAVGVSDAAVDAIARE